MTLDDELLEILVCPKCKGELEYREEGAEDGEALLCHECELRYRVDDGIPVMLVDEAESL